MPDEYSADIHTTGSVKVDGPAMGEIDLRGGRDWFAVTLEAGKTCHFELKGAPTGDGALAVPYLHGIHDANGAR